MYNEGGTCPYCQKGQLVLVQDGECTCHIWAPCAACVNGFLICNSCGYCPEEEETEDGR